MEVITDPEAVAAGCCEFGKRRMGSMQPKWFRRYDVAAATCADICRARKPLNASAPLPLRFQTPLARIGPLTRAFQILYADITGNRLKPVPNTTRLDPCSRRQARHG